MKTFKSRRGSVALAVVITGALFGQSNLTHLFTSQDDSGESIPHTNDSGGTTLGFFFDDDATSSEAAPSGKVYDLRIWSNASLSEEEVKEAVSPPLPPAEVTATPGDASATVSWAGSTNATSYRVTAEPGGATCTVDAPATSCVVDGLTNGTSYTFSVVAIGAGGTSEPSQPSAAVTPVSAPTTTTSITGPVPEVTPTTIGGPNRDPAGTTGPIGSTTEPVSDTTTTTVVSGGTTAVLTDGTDKTASGTLPRTGEAGTKPMSVAGATLAVVGLVLLLTGTRRRDRALG